VQYVIYAFEPKENSGLKKLEGKRTQK